MREALLASLKKLWQEYGSSNKDYNFILVEIKKATTVDKDSFSQVNAEEDNGIHLTEQVHQADFGHPLYSSTWLVTIGTASIVTECSSTRTKGAIRGIERIKLVLIMMNL